MPWDTLEAVPAHLRRLGLKRANRWGRIFDALQGKGLAADHAAAIATMTLAKAAQAHLVHAEHRPPALHAPIASNAARCGHTVLMDSKTGHGRRWQCVDHQGKLVHEEKHRQELERIHRAGGSRPMVRHAAERKHVQDLVHQGLVRLEQNPVHHAHEFTAHLTAAGRRAVERQRGVREADNARRQGVLFKALVKAYVAAHTRTAPSGEVVQVAAHERAHHAPQRTPGPGQRELWRATLHPEHVGPGTTFTASRDQAEALRAGTAGAQLVRASVQPLRPLEVSDLGGLAAVAAPDSFPDTLAAWKTDGLEHVQDVVDQHPVVAQQLAQVGHDWLVYPDPAGQPGQQLWRKLTGAADVRVLTDLGRRPAGKTLAKGRVHALFEALRTLRAGSYPPGLDLELAKASDPQGADIVRRFTVAGDVECVLRRAPSGVYVLTLAHPRWALPFHMIIRSEGEAEQAARAAVPLLLAGRVPDEGVFRRAGPLRLIA